MKLSQRLAQAAEPVRPAATPLEPSHRARSPRRAERPLRAARPDDSGAPTQRPATRESIAALKDTVRRAVIDGFGPALATTAVDEARVRRAIEGQLDEALAGSPVGVAPNDRSRFVDELFADMVGWGPLTPLMDDPSITEIMCNACDEVWVEREGRIERTAVRFASTEDYRLVIDRMLAKVGRRVDEAVPMADGRLGDGSRINAIVPPLAVRSPVLTIRRFPEAAFTMTDLLARESLSADAALFLEAAVRGKLNVVVSGGSSTGKTTMLNVLSGFIPDHERVITIEDAAELRLEQPHVVALEARPANTEGAGRVTIRELVVNALRMRPDRIVVGEARGGEALDMLQAMNTGHEGSLTTVHANSPRDALARLETMVLMSGVELPLRAVREQLASALDVIVQLERRSDGTRVVSEVCEVQGREGDTVTLQSVFARSGSSKLRGTGLRPQCLAKLEERDVHVAPAVFRADAVAVLGVRR